MDISQSKKLIFQFNFAAFAGNLNAKFYVEVDVKSECDVAVKNSSFVETRDGLKGRVVTRMPLLDSGDVDAKRQEILDYFHDSFTLYESLSLIHI